MNIKCLLGMHTFTKWHVVREKFPSIELEKMYFFRACLKCLKTEEKAHKYIDMARSK